MVSFIHDVLNDIDTKYNLSKTIFILPSRRAGIFLKHIVAKKAGSTFFSPEIISIEEFVTELSQLRVLNNTESLFRFYDIYKSLTPKDRVESFNTFSKWGQIILQDFNEIDRFLVDEEHIFDYLKSIQEINHWSLKGGETEITKGYLKFWNRLKTYYSEFSSSLKSEGVGYQGLIYREAVNNLESYIASSTSKHLFLGFNALNKAEEQIIQGLIQNDLADIYWDIDKTFIDNPIHDTGHFVRKYIKEWGFFKKNSLKWLTDYYRDEKNIQVIGCPKQIGQAKYAGQVLSRLMTKNNQSLKNTALVLGDESLLLPVLNSLPSNIESANITMGLPLNSVPLTTLFKKLLSIHEKEVVKFYFKDILEVLNNAIIQLLFPTESLKAYIQSQNTVYLSLKKLIEINPNHEEILRLLFGNWENNPKAAIEKCIKLIYKAKEKLQGQSGESKLELEYLYRFYMLFNELENINSKFPHLDSISDLKTIFLELLNSEKLDFKGEPLEGLQIMGMLETRVLDFETVIITSVNEGILPAGKTYNSFIPFDVKIENGLPTYKEKDAVYTYHFYHLLNRAKNIYIIYNTEVDALNSGEKSRFITQLEVEGFHKIKHKIAAPTIPKIEKNQISVPKNEAIMERLRDICNKGLSPSSLINYVRNPIDFYHQKILGISETEDVEETVAANTLGSVIHNTLEDLYKPFIGNFLSIDDLKKRKVIIEERVKYHFKDIYKSNTIKQGKNLIIFEIAKRYVSNFIDSEIKELTDGNQIKLLAVEEDYTVRVPFDEMEFPINLTGKIDRIDEYNGKLRIIDYKSGKVEQKNLDLYEWAEITQDYNTYGKSFQVLCYAYMIHKVNAISLPIEAGIISFKNLQSGFLKFGHKESAASRSRNSDITSETLIAFEEQLKNLIKEICDPKIAFVEKDINQ